MDDTWSSGLPTILAIVVCVLICFVFDLIMWFTDYLYLRVLFESRFIQGIYILSGICG